MRSVKQWLENEIEDVANAYNQSKDAAAQHVKDLLNEGEYKDELTESEIAVAVQLIKGAK